MDSVKSLVKLINNAQSNHIVNVTYNHLFHLEKSDEVHVISFLLHKRQLKRQIRSVTASGFFTIL